MPDIMRAALLPRLLTPFLARRVPRAAPPHTREMADAAQGMATIFDKGNWYHELLEDGLAISYRVRRLPIALLVLPGGGGAVDRPASCPPWPPPPWPPPGLLLPWPPPSWCSRRGLDAARVGFMLSFQPFC